MWLMLIGNEASGVYESEDGTTCPHFLRLLCYSRNPVPLLILNLYRPDGDPKRFGAPVIAGSLRPSLFLATTWQSVNLPAWG